MQRPLCLPDESMPDLTLFDLLELAAGVLLQPPVYVGEDMIEDLVP